jgi:hypothetical protein
MKSIPSRLRIVLFCLGAILSVGLILAGHGYYQLTAPVDAAGLQAPNNLDAKELERKRGMFEAALKTSRHGFIRLSEVEINSYLHEHYHLKAGGGAAAEAENGCRLLKCNADLITGGVVFYSWVQVNWRGRSRTVCWQRMAEVRRAGDHWEFALTSMHVGRQQIPQRYWANVTEFLHGADQPFSESYAWLTKIPNLEIRLSEIGHQPELRLYTFPNTGQLRQAQR